MSRTLSILISLLAINLSLHAQDKWILKSENLSKPNTVLVFKPDTYNKNEKYPLVYLLHGYSENYEQWSQTSDLQKLSNQYGMIIVTPDGFVSFYSNSVSNKKSQWENFFFKDLVPEVHKTFNIDEKNIFISGLSMGGFGALRLFILHQNYFNTAGSTSGALEVDYNNFKKISQHFWQSNRLADDAKTVFGSPEKNGWHKYNITELLKNKKIQKPFLIDCGMEDVVYPFSVNLKAVADSLKIPVTFISQPGNHNTEYWKKSIEYHFIYFKQNLKK